MPPRDPDGAGRTGAVLAVIALGLGIGLRFFRLDADPDYYLWNGYVTDEGRWTAHARAMALFGDMGSVGWPLHLALAPLYQLASYGFFAALDVSLWSSRLVSAVCGSALLLTFWAAFRRLATPEALLLALVMLAFEPDLVVLSRIAVPEMAAMSLSLLAYVLLVAEGAGGARLAAAGIITAAAIGMKVTVLLVAPIFAVILLVRPPASADGRSRGAALAAYAAGLLLPVALAGLGVLTRWPDAAAGIRRTVDTVSGFIGLTEPYAVVAFPFEDPVAPVLGIWTLAAGLAFLGALVARSDAAGALEGRYLAAAGIWVVLYGGAMLVLEYFPARYKLHLLVPLAVIVAVGLTTLQRVGLGPLEAALADLRGVRRMVVVLLLAVPTAILLAPGLAVLATMGGIDVSRVRVRYACVLVALALVGALLLRLQHGGARRLALLFPPLWVLAWLIAQRPPVWLPASGPAATGEFAARWLLLVAAAVVGVVAVSAGLARGKGGGARWGMLAVATAYALIALVRLAPGYLDPHYSIRAASRDLGQLLAGAAQPVRTLESEALFSDNRLPYRIIHGRQWPPSRPELLLLGAPMHDPLRLLEREYRLVRTYRIYTSPEYVRMRLSRVTTPGPLPRTSIRLYQRIPPGG
jgi:Dolichyl-phosphate-mannose-protein mannosyltransferase